MTYIPKIAYDELVAHCKRNDLAKAKYVCRLILEDLERVTGKKFNHETQKFERGNRDEKIRGNNVKRISDNHICADKRS
jgi:hypothetical protein